MERATARRHSLGHKRFSTTGIAIPNLATEKSWQSEAAFHLENTHPATETEHEIGAFRKDHQNPSNTNPSEN